MPTRIINNYPKYKIPFSILWYSKTEYQNMRDQIIKDRNKYGGRREFPDFYGENGIEVVLLKQIKDDESEKEDKSTNDKSTNQKLIKPEIDLIKSKYTTKSMVKTDETIKKIEDYESEKEEYDESKKQIDESKIEYEKPNIPIKSNKSEKQIIPIKSNKSDETKIERESNIDDKIKFNLNEYEEYIREKHKLKHKLEKGDFSSFTDIFEKYKTYLIMGGSFIGALALFNNMNNMNGINTNTNINQKDESNNGFKF